MARILACPFCRELFGSEEGRRCPTCDIALVPMESLPPSAEALEEAEAAGEIDPPEDRPQSLFYAGRGRAALVAVATAGLAAFFAPWARLKRPDEVTLSGFDLARSNAVWLWGGAIGWFLVLPLVASRRSVREMRGIRVVTTTFALLTVLEVTMLLARPPAGHRYFGSGLEYAWGLYASGVLGCLGAFLGAFRLGGSLTDFRDLPTTRSANDRRPGEALH